MASSPRTGRSNVALWSLVIGIGLLAFVIGGVIAGVDYIKSGEVIVSGLFPPVAVTSEGAQIRDLYTIVFIIAAVIFFVVEGLIVWTVVRYRRKPGDDVLPVQTHGNAIAEIVWTIVPTIIVAFLFVISWQTLNAVDTPAASPDTKIRAVAGQFQWTFDYLPSDWDPERPTDPIYTEFVPVGEDGGLHVPTGRIVRLYLQSQDVIHAFYVPQFLFKRDVVPGRVNTFEFTVDEDDAGQNFRGQCAELCGSGHRDMLFDVHALSGAEFDAWLEAKQNAPSPPPPPPGESGAPTTPGGGPTLTVTALNIQFSPTELTAPADTPFTIGLDNQDPDTPHNIAISDSSGAEVFKGEIFPGLAERVYDIPPLAAGTYPFVCTVHPNMTGTLTVN